MGPLSTSELEVSTQTCPSYKLLASLLAVFSQLHGIRPPCAERRLLEAETGCRELTQQLPVRQGIGRQ